MFIKKLYKASRGRCTTSDIIKVMCVRPKETFGIEKYVDVQLQSSEVTKRLKPVLYG